MADAAQGMVGQKGVEQRGYQSGQPGYAELPEGE